MKNFYSNSSKETEINQILHKTLEETIENNATPNNRKKQLQNINAEEECSYAGGAMCPVLTVQRVCQKFCAL
jgi:hypothetical protein